MVPDGRQSSGTDRAFKIKKFLEDYGEQMGYDRTSFYQQMLKKFRNLERDPEVLKSMVGVQRSGGTWVGYRQRLTRWLENTVKPGPNHGVQVVPDHWDAKQFLDKANGVYHLKAVLKKLNPEIVTYWKVTGAVKRSQNPGPEVGVTLRNGVYVVDMAHFRGWYRKHEPQGG